MFNVGWIASSAAVWRQGENPQRRIRFPVPAYVVDTGRERILVDTGLHPAAAVDPGAFYGPRTAGLTLELDRDISAQINFGTISCVVLTHLHFDHAGGLAFVPSRVPVILQRRELQAARDPDAIARNFFYPRDYETLGDRDVMLIDGDHDLLGDGTVQLMLTPGHTPGHQSLVLDGRLVLAGDVVHFLATLDDKRFPVFGDDFNAQSESVDRLRALRDAGLTIMPGHDPQTLKPGPIATF